MVQSNRTTTPAQLAVVTWAARIGGVTADALAQREDCTMRCARERLRAAERAGLLTSARPLTASPALFTPTRAGLRAAGLPGLEVSRTTASNAGHAIACAGVAATLERLYPEHRTMGERELRGEEHAHGGALASASLSAAPSASQLHRPDLVLWPAAAGSLPVAVEVELTVKAPQRLFEICRAWARCRCVAGVLYVASEEVMRPLARAIEKADAQQRIAVLAIRDLSVTAALQIAEGQASQRTVPSDA